MKLVLGVGWQNTSRYIGNRKMIMGKSSKSSISNPWTGISWSKTIAPCDELYFNCKYGSPANYAARYSKAGLNFNCLPEPFSGDINSPVYCLNMNPGSPDPDFKGDLNFEKLTQDNLNLRLKGPFWANKKCLTLPNGKVHCGVAWFEKRTKDLTSALGYTPNLFFIDFFPYHSDDGFYFPSWLPSYAFTNELIENAMKLGKFIVIMRQKERWFKRISGLKNYSLLAFLESGQNGCLSKNNVIYKCDAFNDLESYL